MSQTSRQVATSISSASWIRRMFDEGNRLKGQHGAENVFDFSLGNPHLEPPRALLERLRDLTANPASGTHRYMPNPGFPAVREKVAAFVSNQQGCAVSAAHVVMIGGAACGLNVVFRAMLDPGDQVVVPAPYFAEYPFYAANAGATCVFAETDAQFDLDLDALEHAISAQTRAVLINSPNNPTGRVYPAASIEALAALLDRRNEDRDRPIVLVADEPYRRLVYDDTAVPLLFEHYPQTILVASFSKDLGLAGERIGYLALHPDFSGADELSAGIIFCLRTLGFVNAPALMQLAVAEVLESSVDLAAYQHNRDVFYNGLTRIGYEVVKPEGAFYLFPKSPLADDREFVSRLQDELVLAVPGRGFGRPGYFRLSYAVEPDVITRALPRFESAFAKQNGAKH